MVMVWALAPIAFLVVKANALHASISAGPGIFVADQLQYLSWIRSASDHLLAANGFELGSGGHVLLHPMFVLSGLAVRAGLNLPLSMLIWTPIAAAVLVYGCWKYIARTVDSTWARAAALIVAIFFVSPAAPIIGWTLSAPSRIQELPGELFPGGELWGYAPLVLTIGLMPLFVLGLERIVVVTQRAADRSRTWYVAWTSVAGLLVSWLHPWQGETLLLVVGGLVVWSRLWVRWKELAIPVLAAAAPLVYYFALSRFDASWRLAQAQTPLARPSVLLLMLAIAPLAVVAIVGLWRGAMDVQKQLLVLWPVACLSVYFVFATSDPLHGLEGLSVPLSILAVRGWPRLRLPTVAAVAAVLAVTVPGVVYTIDGYRKAVDAGGQPYFLHPAEQRALAFIARSPDEASGVLPSPLISAAVPAYTAHRAWLGHPQWTPNFGQRVAVASRLFGGRIGAAPAQEMLRQIGARYVLADCDVSRDMTPILGHLLLSRHQFGCASVYELRLNGRSGML